MKFLAGLLALFVLLVTFLPASAQVNVEAFMRKRTEEFMLARQARKGEVMRKYYDLTNVKQVHEELKLQYISIKEDLKKGVFTEQYIRHSIEDSNFGESYKEALLRFLFKNSDFDKELDLALSRYLGSYEYTITKFQIEQVAVLPDGKTVKVKITETRKIAGQNKKIAGQIEDQTVPRIYKWELKNNAWLLSMDNTPNL